jgi:ADP-dependent NAD(P)H-hydrate dehydratase / NAD(P)H-hydrate epimerase
MEVLHREAVPALMERAGRAAAQFALSLLEEVQGSVLVLAGPGNNGGDGFVLARCLREAGRDVFVVSIGPAERYPADAAVARRSWLDAGGLIHADFSGTQWSLAVDALFGIGLTRAIEGVYAEWIDRLNALPCPRLALDVPSGLNAETGVITGPCVVASHTASFIGLKPGLLTLDGPDQCGQVEVFNLGLPAVVSVGKVLAPSCFGAHLQPRKHNVHKGSFGSAGIIGGAPGMRGAALLASRAALYLGPGKVFLGLLDTQGAGVDLLHPEIMWREPTDLSGMVSALAVGPGLGKGEKALTSLVNSLEFDAPLLLDADALNLIAEDPALARRLAQREAPGVLTPHPAEAARLMQCSVAQIQSDRVISAIKLAQQTACVVVLKGCGSVVASPDGRWFINTIGHGGMASGGMGDALAGLIVALLAQGWPVLEAALCGVHLHAAAADRLALQGIGPVGLTASDTLPAARCIFNEWLTG